MHRPSFLSQISFVVPSRGQLQTAKKVWNAILINSKGNCLILQIRSKNRWNSILEDIKTKQFPMNSNNQFYETRICISERLTGLYLYKLWMNEFQIRNSHHYILHIDDLWQILDICTCLLNRVHIWFHPQFLLCYNCILKERDHFLH